MPINYKSYSGKCRLERSLVQCSETQLNQYLFHIGITLSGSPSWNQ
jgi:hypothetical protein